MKNALYLSVLMFDCLSRYFPHEATVNVAHFIVAHDLDYMVAKDMATAASFRISVLLPPIPHNNTIVDKAKARAGCS